MISWLFSTLLLSLRVPRAGMRQIMMLERPQGTEMVALLLMAVASALLMQLSLHLTPLPQDMPFAILFASPFVTVTLQFVVLVLTAVLTWLVGGWFGGRAGFPDAVLAVAWLQAIMMAAQVLQLALLFILPVLSGLIGIAAIGLFVVLLSHFIAEIHGFSSPLKVLFVAAMTFIATVFVLTIIITPFIPPEYLPHGL